MFGVAFAILMLLILGISFINDFFKNEDNRKMLKYAVVMAIIIITAIILIKYA